MFYFSALRGEAACHPRKGIIPFLSAVLAAELSYVVSFIVNNAFSFSYMLKFVLKHFRKLVEVLFQFWISWPSNFSPNCFFSPIVFPDFFSFSLLFFSSFFEAGFQKGALVSGTAQLPCNHSLFRCDEGKRWPIDSLIGSAFKFPFEVSINIIEWPTVSWLNLHLNRRHTSVVQKDF